MTPLPIQAPGKPDTRVSIRHRIAMRKLGNPAGFKFYRWEFIAPDTTLMTGCVVTRTVQRGPRKGLPAYDGPAVKVAVTEAEERAEEALHEAETGQCARCLGDTVEWCGWNRETGHRYRTCSRCAGTGKAPTA